MANNTSLYLPLETKLEHVMKVVARVAGSQWRKTSFSDSHTVSRRPLVTKQVQRPFDGELPASPSNPWFIEFTDDVSTLNVASSNMSSCHIHFVDAAGQNHAWTFFQENEQMDEDGLFIKNAKCLYPGSHALAVATCKRLVQVFGGELRYRDRDDGEFDEVVNPKDAKFPPRRPGTSSNDFYYAFENMLANEQVLSVLEIEQAKTQCAYSPSKELLTLQNRLSKQELEARLEENLPDAPPQRKPRARL